MPCKNITSCGSSWFDVAAHFLFLGNMRMKAISHQWLKYSWRAGLFIHRLRKNVYYQWISSNFSCQWNRIAIEWFRSYLTGRKQSVRIGCETSEPRLVSYGVPQGSILGPALFNIYINDLPSVPKVGSLECYVDDSQLYLSFPVRDATLAAAQLTEDLRNIATWCCKNSLLINPEKQNFWF